MLNLGKSTALKVLESGSIKTSPSKGTPFLNYTAKKFSLIFVNDCYSEILLTFLANNLLPLPTATSETPNWSS